MSLRKGAGACGGADGSGMYGPLTHTCSPGAGTPTESPQPGCATPRAELPLWLRLMMRACWKSGSLRQFNFCLLFRFFLSFSSVRCSVHWRIAASSSQHCAVELGKSVLCMVLFRGGVSITRRMMI